jgi:aquaporin Z
MWEIPIRIRTGSGGWHQIKASFLKNWRLYIFEAIGLGIFMISACLFAALLEGKTNIHEALPDNLIRTLIMGLLMGATALFIFYFPPTASSGSQINPAVTLTFLRLGRMCPWDAFFYILFQFIGGTLAVLLMQLFLGPVLTDSPVRSVVTIPVRGLIPAAITEFLIALVTMLTVLLTSARPGLFRYTRIFCAFLVSTWVILAGPISGFGMNPARTFASALPANTWTAIWLYMTMPVAGMLLAAECFLLINKNIKPQSQIGQQPNLSNNYSTGNEDVINKIIV